MRPQTYALLGVLIALLISLPASAAVFEIEDITGLTVYEGDGSQPRLYRHKRRSDFYNSATAACQSRHGPYRSANGNSWPVVAAEDFNGVMPGPTGGSCCFAFGTGGNTCSNSGMGFGDDVSWTSTGNTCTEGDIWREATQDCGPLPPPTDAECEAANGPGYVYSSFTIGGVESGSCVLPLPDATDQEDCSNPVGTVTYQGSDHVVCGDDADECAATGGTWGTYGPVGQEQTVCLASDYADDLPTCDGDGVFVADADSGSFVCESPVPDPDVPNQEDNQVPDSDGDGTPNNNDGDIDGDGIPNSTDTDIDGDGIDNADDPTPEGEQEKEDASVEGGNDCNVAPRCTGDAVQCAMLYQLWKTRCAAQESEGGESEFDIDSFTSQNTVGDITSDPTDLSTEMTDIYNQVGIAGACPAPATVNVLGQTFSMPYTDICDFAGMMKPLVLIAFSFWAFLIVMRAFD